MLKAITLQNNTKTSRKLKFLSVNALKTYGFCKKRRRFKKLKSLASKSVKKLTTLEFLISWWVQSFSFSFFDKYSRIFIFVFCQIFLVSREISLTKFFKIWVTFSLFCKTSIFLNILKKIKVMFTS